MAGDWIKMRVWISRDPKVIAIADFLAADADFLLWLSRQVGTCADDVTKSSVTFRVTCHTRRVTASVTVTALLQIWGVAREQGDRVGDDLVLRHASFSTLDEIGDVPGIGAAMASVGWADGWKDGGVVFPKFFVQNHDTTELKRADAAERKRKSREKARDKTCGGHSKMSQGGCDMSHVRSREMSHREEERRGENREEETPPLSPSRGKKKPFVPEETKLPPELDNDTFRPVWGEWCKFRRERGQSLKPTTVARQLKFLASIGLQRAVAAMENSITNGYQGLFEPKANGQTAPAKPRETEQDMIARCLAQDAARQKILRGES